MSEKHEIHFITAGGGGSAIASGGIAQSSEDDASSLQKFRAGFGKDRKSFFKSIGLDVTLKAMLKQSQVFTNTAGAFF